MTVVLQNLIDQWPIDSEMMLFHGVSVYGDGFVWVWDGIDEFWMEIG